MKSLLAYRVLGFYLILQCLCFVTADVHQARCAADQFRCDDGNCIPSQRSCDGIKDCRDGSDETFVACHNSTCNNKTFRCSYGGCIPNAQKCNGRMDCWDETDENIYECATDEVLFQFIDGLQGNCSTPNTFQCGNQCIPMSEICDGKPDCADKSDETHRLCAGSICPAYAFRCGYGGCIGSASLCNHKRDCLDGSDELSQICQNDSLDWWVEHSTERCAVAAADGHMLVRELFTNSSCVQDDSVEHGTLVRLSCAKGYHIQGSSQNACNNGKWKTAWPQCVRVCGRGVLTRETSRVPRCTYQGVQIDCQTAALFMGTQVSFKCDRGFQARMQRELEHKLVCNASGKWSNEQSDADQLVMPKCVAQCGRISLDLASRQEKPWVVSIYERENASTFEFRCLGTIISEYVIVTTGYCVTGSSDHTAYTIAEGKHVFPFAKDEAHGYRLHNISQIQHTHNKATLAILRLVNPLQLSAMVQPVCLQHSIAAGLDSVYQEESVGLLGEAKTFSIADSAYLADIIITMNTTSHQVTYMQIYPFLNVIKKAIDQ